MLYENKGYLFSSSSPIDTVISSSNGIRLPIPCVLVHDIRICHRGRDHRLLQQAVKQHPARAGCAPVEAEHEFIEIGVQVVWLYRAMMCSQHPALYQ